MITKYQVVTASSANELAQKVQKFLNEGWNLNGSYNVVTKISQNTYSGTQLMRTIHTAEYSHCMTKNVDPDLELYVVKSVSSD